MKQFVIIVGLICMSYSSYCQLKNTEADILYAKAIYKDVNKRLKSFAKDSIELEESTEGGEAVRYIENNKARLIVANYYGETGSTRAEYYYDELGNLIFLVKFKYRYNTHIMDKKFNDKKTQTFIMRYYFSNGILIKMLDSTIPGKKFPKAEIDEQQKEIMDYNKTWSTKFASPK
jgi:hypothetical protein